MELAAQAEHPGDQRADPPRAPVPGAGRRVHDRRSGSATLDGVVLAFVGDGNNVYHSLALLGAALGMEIRLAHPAGLRARTSGSSTRAQELADGVRWRGCRSVTTRSRPSAAPTSSTPTPGPRWARRPRPRTAATPSPAYQVDDALLDAAGPDALAMHCLPAHRGEEITSAVMDGPRSLIFEQSENRLHVQKALLVELLGSAAAA